MLFLSRKKYRPAYIHGVSEWCSKNAIMILHPAKTKSMPLATRQKYQLRPLTLSLNLKDSLIERIHEHQHLAVILDDEFSWHPQTVSKNLFLLSQLKNIVCPSANYFIMFTFLRILPMHLQSGMVVVISYSKSSTLSI